VIERFGVWARARGAGMAAASGALAAALAGCCFGGAPSLPPPPVPPPPVPPLAGAAPSTATVHGTAVALAPGFAPDPTLLVGNAGGPVEASTMGAECRGTVGAAPNFVLQTAAAMPNLRVVVSSPADTTLVVRLSDGRVLCDDDGGGYPNPMVSGSFPAGSHQIYVGTYSPDATGAAFTLGLTANPTVTAASLGAAPPIPGVLPGALPRQCGASTADFGPITVGASVLLGAHTSYTGPDGQGGLVAPGSESELNWSPEMQPYVGQRTAVTGLEGLDAAGCTVVRVAADQGQFFWRVRDMTL
jgi:hypothetical protein